MINSKSLRSLRTKTSYLHQYRRLISIEKRPREPLRILFCGSDAFSATSLQALENDRTTNPTSVIQSIDVVCRPGKRWGRGLKYIKPSPIRKIVEELQLTIHETDTFTGWTPPRDINLIIAVSFGLLVPPRILGAAKYGGLNIHPSMLPDLRGPAPIYHALLLNRSYTGVTLQTLHPSKFDCGQILAQTDAPGIPIDPCMAPSDLQSILATSGADMLLESLNNGVFVPPIQEAEALSAFDIELITGGKGVAHAPKITPEDRRIDWANMTTAEILHRNHVLHPLWDTTTYNHMLPMANRPSAVEKRVIFTQGFDNTEKRLQEEMANAEHPPTEPGQPVVLRRASGFESLAIKTVDGGVLVNACTVAGGKLDQGVPTLIRMEESRWRQ